jgi:hypothetical protein
MARKLGPYGQPTHVLIVRDGEGKHINGTGSRGDLTYAKGLAYSYLRIDLTGLAASIDIFRYDPTVSWLDLQPLTTVTLDDEGVSDE